MHRCRILFEMYFQDIVFRKYISGGKKSDVRQAARPPSPAHETQVPCRAPSRVCTRPGKAGASGEKCWGGGVKGGGASVLPHILLETLIFLLFVYYMHDLLFKFCFRIVIKALR